MYTFSSPAAVREALHHYSLRPSKTTGRTLSQSTGKLLQYFMTDEVAGAFCTSLRGHELMREIDRRLVDAPTTYRSVGIVMLSQFANYYQFLNEEEYKWWCREGGKRYKPRTPISEKVLSRTTLKKYFDGFLADDPDHYTKARLYCFSALLLMSGARHSAIAELKASDIRISDNTITISIRRLKSSNTAPQVIHIPMDVLLPNGRPVGEAIHSYIDIRPNCDMLFTTWTGEHGSGLKMSIRNQMLRHGARFCEGEIVRPHMFRYTTASIVSDHVGVRQAQHLLGHANLETTMRYAGHFYDNVSSKTIATAFKGFANHSDESYL